MCLLTEHPFTDRSALYRIPLELVKNRKLHNEMLFFWVCFWFFQDSTNFKTCLFAAVNFCHWRFWFISHSGLWKLFLTIFGPRVRRSACISTKKTSLNDMHEKFWSKLLVTKIDRSKKHLISILQNLHKVKRSF